MNRREILFRGQSVIGREWIYGFYVKDDEDALIAKWNDKDGKFDYYAVIPSTIGQYVGKIGANSCEVWEGDKVIARLNHHGKPTKLEIPAFIDYNEHVGTWQIRYENSIGQLVSDDIGFRYFLEVIGTIHDNPELIQQS